MKGSAGDLSAGLRHRSTLATGAARRASPIADLALATDGEQQGDGDGAQGVHALHRGNNRADHQPSEITMIFAARRRDRLIDVRGG